MRTLFYLIGVIAILYEFTVVIETKKYTNAIKTIRENRNKFDNLSQSLKNFSFLQLGYFIWVIVGLFSSNWILFIVIFLLSVFPKRNFVFLRRLDAFLTLDFLILILLNKFQLHIHWLTFLGY